MSTDAECVTKPTPGPWVLFRRWDQLWVAANNAWAICHIEPWKRDIDEADANLIAAAPDMLEALKAQHRALDVLMAALVIADRTFMPTKSSVWPLIMRGADAIKKAEGRDV